MHRRRVPMVGLASFASLLVAAPVCAGAAAAASPRQTYSETFSTTRPGAPAGALLKVDWLGDRPGEKPHSITDDVFTLAKGARFDFSVPATCRATNAQLSDRGPSACPKRSEVADGEIDLDVGQPFAGVPRIIKTHATIFDGGRGKLVTLAVTTNLGVPIATVDRSSVRGTGIITANPPLPGFPPPDPFVAVKRDRIHFLKVTKRTGKRVRGFLTTPPTCPRSGKWTNRATFRYHDKVTQHAVSHSRCAAKKGA